VTTCAMCNPLAPSCRLIIKHFSSGTTTSKSASMRSRFEAISLYREILRTAKPFHWCDEQGRPWNARLKAEARKEFELARLETDPLIVARLLVQGRDCVQQIQIRFNEANKKVWERIERDTSRR
jgi:hypothetical protein